jgi:hypothetical protein
MLSPSLKLEMERCFDLIYKLTTYDESEAPRVSILRPLRPKFVSFVNAVAELGDVGFYQVFGLTHAEARQLVPLMFPCAVYIKKRGSCFPEELLMLFMGRMRQAVSTTLMLGHVFGRDEAFVSDFVRASMGTFYARFSHLLAPGTYF